MPLETRYRDIQKTGELGYDSIPLHRPKFVYFEFTGLRPSVPHWVFFGGIEVTKFCNTSYSKSDYESASRNSVLKEPGEQFTNATEFPTGGGLPFGGPTASGGPTGPVYSDANGVLSGVFYLQSNTTYNWNLKVGGTELMVIDVSNANKDNAYSVGTGLFRGIGQYENYYNYTVQESYEVWVEPPPPVVIVDTGDDTDIDEPDDVVVTNNNNNDDPKIDIKTGNNISNITGTFTNINFDYGDYGISHSYDDTGNFTISDDDGNYGTNNGAIDMGWKKVGGDASGNGGYWTRS